MNTSVKKVRAVIVTIALIAVTNFAISYAESVSVSRTSKENPDKINIFEYQSFGSSDQAPVPGPRPTSSLASSDQASVPGPRPQL